jgi:hypothetical protein
MPKLAKTHPRAKYQPRPNGPQRCGLCTMFRSPDRCTAVAGDISPQGWCKLFKRRARRGKDSALVNQLTAALEEIARGLEGMGILPEASELARRALEKTK